MTALLEFIDRSQSSYLFSSAQTCIVGRDNEGLTIQFPGYGGL